MNLIKNIHFEQHSQKGKQALFFGANGFPTGCYAPLFEHLSDELALSALHSRATWPKQPLPKNLTWRTYIDDLIYFIEHHIQQPVIGIGHSMGASITLFASLKRPDLFRQLILIEPAMTSPVIAKLLPIIPFAIAKRVQPIKYTVNKPQDWQSVACFYQDLRQRRVFRRIADKHLRIMAEQSLVPNKAGNFSLKFPKQWEAKNYATAPNLYNSFAKNSLPTTAIRGKPSIYFSERSWQVWQQKSPSCAFLEDDNFGHLLPLESPEKCAEMIFSGIERHNAT